MLTQLFKSNIIGMLISKLGSKATANPGTTNLFTVLIAAGATYVGVDVHKVAEVLHALANFIDKVPIK